VPNRANKTHPALKHAGYSAATILPGEDAAAFDRLHQKLAAEFNPARPLEESIVADMARLMWRKQNLATYRIPEQVKKYCSWIASKKVSAAPPRSDIFIWEEMDGSPEYREQFAEATRMVESQVRQEPGEIYGLIGIGKLATIDGLMNELNVSERLDGLIEKCLKRLLMVRGVNPFRSHPLPRQPRKKSLGYASLWDQHGSTL
jgi:hypothetical protein